MLWQGVGRYVSVRWEYPGEHNYSKAKIYPLIHTILSDPSWGQG